MPGLLPPVLPPGVALNPGVGDGGPATLLYRAYCRCGVLAYVGVTNNLLSRIGGHAASPSYRWVCRVARWE
ncbi:hypothetical protein [Geodermatophilus obscurus]|nr:hypothetical protein [Geodermatophilus obscurus]